jgi:peroxiredoxin/mono/diheme cytochrome c family protein
MPSAVLPLLLLLSLAADPGQAVEDFTLRDHRGAERSLGDWHDSKLVVVVFLGVDCPLAKLYGPRLADLAAEFEPRGVAFVGINSNRYDSVTAIARYAQLHPLPFPLLKDPGNVVADRFDARRTPEAFVLDPDRVVRYRGRIDDQYSVGTHRAAVGRRDLAVALEELLAGKPVSEPVTQPAGCLISRVRKPADDGTVTYTRDVAPVLQNHCQVCHRPGEIAPFTLTSYQDAVAWSGTIGEVLRDGRMPPWHANPAHGKFANDPRLGDAEKEAVFAWIAQGCPEGDPANLPSPPTFPDGWTIPKPDLVLSMSEPFTVPAQGTVEYQFIEVDPGFKEDRWIKAAEIRPGNRAVVHHCTVFLKPPGQADPAAEGALGSYCLAATAPGTPPLTLPDGMAKRIPAGWKLLFVLHYTTVGSVQTDRTSIGLVFANRNQVRQEVATKIMMDLDLVIPPHTPDHKVEQTWRVNDPVLLLAFFPHAHLRGKSFRYDVTYPDGTMEILLDVPRYDFNWQHRYVLAQPKRLPAGSFLRCTAVYDNSSGNPANPDPGATVRAGLQSWDEMFNGYFDVALADQDLTKELPGQAELTAALHTLGQPGVAGLVVVFGGVFLVGRRLARRRRTGQGG